MTQPPDNPPATRRTLPAHWPDWATERDCHAQGYGLVAGCDEVGRGAWAGPLVAVAVIFPPDFAIGEHETQNAEAEANPDTIPHSALRAPHSDLAGVRDSKQLTPQAREALAVQIRRHALAVGVGLVSPGLGDRIGWGAANRLALTRAVRALPLRPDYLLLDAFGLPGLALPQLPLIKGDSRCVSIAAASIIAKVTRDRLMVALDAEYPAYGFAAHKGYGTSVHAAALETHGPTPIHRHSFAPVREWGVRNAACGMEDADDATLVDEPEVPEETANNSPLVTHYSPRDD